MEVGDIVKSKGLGIFKIINEHPKTNEEYPRFDIQDINDKNNIHTHCYLYNGCWTKVATANSIKQETTNHIDIEHKSIMILTEKDLELERLACLMCGKDIHTLFVPRRLNNDELNIVIGSITCGSYQTGKILIYK